MSGLTKAMDKYEERWLKELDRLEEAGFLPPVPNGKIPNYEILEIKPEVKRQLRKFAIYPILPEQVQNQVESLYLKGANAISKNPFKTADCEELEGRLKYLSDNIPLINGALKSPNPKAVTSSIKQYLTEGTIDNILYKILDSTDSSK